MKNINKVAVAEELSKIAKLLISQHSEATFKVTKEGYVNFYLERRSSILVEDINASMKGLMEDYGRLLMNAFGYKMDESQFVVQCGSGYFRVSMSGVIEAGVGNDMNTDQIVWWLSKQGFDKR